MCSHSSSGSTEGPEQSSPDLQGWKSHTVLMGNKIEWLGQKAIGTIILPNMNIHCENLSSIQNLMCSCALQISHCTSWKYSIGQTRGGTLLVPNIFCSNSIHGCVVVLNSGHDYHHLVLPGKYSYVTGYLCRQEI